MTTSPAMASKIELWALDQLTPYAHNSRTHSDDQIARIAASILEFGVNNPILVDSKGGIVAGHGRLLAARKLGLQTVPVVVLDHLSEAQVESLDSLAGPTSLPITALPNLPDGIRNRASRHRPAGFRAGGAGR